MVTAGKFDPMLLTGFSKILREELEESSLFKRQNLNRKMFREKTGVKKTEIAKGYHRKKHNFGKSKLQRTIGVKNEENKTHHKEYR